VLRTIFGPMREEVAGHWRRLHNKELHNLYPSSSVISVIKSRMRYAYIILVGNPGGKKPFGRPMCRWEDNIRMDLKEI